MSQRNNKTSMKPAGKPVILKPVTLKCLIGNLESGLSIWLMFYDSKSYSFCYERLNVIPSSGEKRLFPR